ncbi:MAG TPA: glycosyltransferase [Solirubrobacteraceae bacterium]|nr:glycosyltransferase [Solirubrobacteraceae bacterium]
MALRLTKTSLPAAASLSDAEAAQQLYHAENQQVQAFISRAASHIAAGDLNAYVQLFSDAAEFENPSRAYQVRKLLLERGLASLQTVSEKRATELLLAMARGAINVLELDPAEPVLLNYAGVIMYELWALDGAKALFQAAKRLDPELPHLDRNLEEISKRGRSGAHKKLVFHPVLAELSKRARRVAGRAKPAEGQRLSLVMIVRDEEEMLPRTLEAVKGAVDEIIIVDTGSADATIEIAKSFGATVIEREWTGNFSDARNASLEAATGDWFIYLDADEVLVAEDVDKLRALTGQTWREAFFLHETNFTGDEGNGVSVVHSALRMFRNRPNYRFSGRLHEQIALHLPAYLPERRAQSPVRINHYGYLGVVRESKDKARRNLDLLLAQQRETPAEALNAFFYYNIGSEYFASAEVDKAVEQFEIAMTKLESGNLFWHEYAPSLVLRSVKALRAASRFEEALKRSELGLVHFPGFTDLVYEQGMSSLGLERAQDATRYMEQAIEMGDAPARYTATVGAGTFLPRTILATTYLNRGQWDQALELLRWCVESHPEHIGTIYPYATALLKSGSDAAEVVALVEGSVPKLPAAGRFMLGTALFEQGHAAAAEAQFRKVIEKQPHGWAARAALVESLMFQRRYAEAAAEAENVSEEDGAAVVVVRSELFARLLAGDQAGAELALEKAERVGLPRSERGLYASWLAQQRGRTEPAPPAAGLSLLSLMLESLLRVQDFENFESLLPLLERVPVAERERRELLAQMYLRRGYLRSAGREWMAVAQQRPDVRALVGLAQVALGNGQPETAESFAAEALTLEPHNEPARRLRELAGERAGTAPVPVTA